MSRILLFLLLVGFLAAGCEDENPDPGNGGDLSSIPYNPVPHFIEQLQEFPAMKIPEENPLTKDGIALGRHLFFDPILSSDSTMGCFSCHLPAGGFTDNLSVRKGGTGVFGIRSSMSLMNVGYYEKGLFWDGRVSSLEAQALLPVEDPIELHHTWPELEQKLQEHPTYPELFRKAFGIQNKNQITKTLAAKAIAQFERTILVGKNSRFSKLFVLQDGFPTAEELNGSLMFFDASGGTLPAAQCFHCHNRPLFTNNDYINNGLDEAFSLNDFPDKGRGEVTGRLFENGKFRTPTLWNVALTAPYMHDGRFNTLEEVLNHYASGGHYADNLDPLITDIHLSEENKRDIIIFLKTLTDTVSLKKPELQNPFQ